MVQAAHDPEVTRRLRILRGDAPSGNRYEIQPEVKQLLPDAYRPQLLHTIVRDAYCEDGYCKHCRFSVEEIQDGNGPPHGRCSGPQKGEPCIECGKAAVVALKSASQASLMRCLACRHMFDSARDREEKRQSGMKAMTVAEIARLILRRSKVEDPSALLRDVIESDTAAMLYRTVCGSMLPVTVGCGCSVCLRDALDGSWAKRASSVEVKDVAARQWLDDCVAAQARYADEFARPTEREAMERRAADIYNRTFGKPIGDGVALKSASHPHLKDCGCGICVAEQRMKRHLIKEVQDQKLRRFSVTDPEQYLLPSKVVHPARIEDCLSQEREPSAQDTWIAARPSAKYRAQAAACMCETCMAHADVFDRACPCSTCKAHFASKVVHPTRKHILKGFTPCPCEECKASRQAHAASIEARAKDASRYVGFTPNEVYPTGTVVAQQEPQDKAWEVLMEENNPQSIEES